MRQLKIRIKTQICLITKSVFFMPIPTGLCQSAPQTLGGHWVPNAPDSAPISKHWPFSKALGPYEYA